MHRYIGKFNLSMFLGLTEPDGRWWLRDSCQIVTVGLYVCGEWRAYVQTHRSGGNLGDGNCPAGNDSTPERSGPLEPPQSTTRSGGRSRLPRPGPLTWGTQTRGNRRKGVKWERNADSFVERIGRLDTPRAICRGVGSRWFPVPGSLGLRPELELPPWETRAEASLGAYRAHNGSLVPPGIAIVVFGPARRGISGGRGGPSCSSQG